MRWCVSLFVLLLCPPTAQALGFKHLDAEGYGMRPARFDAGGGLTLASLGKSGKPGKTERVVLSERHANAIRKAIEAANLETLPPPRKDPGQLNLAKLSEPYALTLVFEERTVRYAFNSMDARGEGEAAMIASRLLPIVQAVRAAEQYLDTPSVRTAIGRFEVGVQDGRVGVGVDEWSLYHPLADGPLVERLRPFKGRRIKMEVEWERDRPEVYTLRRILQKLPKD